LFDNYSTTVPESLDSDSEPFGSYLTAVPELSVVDSKIEIIR